MTKALNTRIFYLLFLITACLYIVYFFYYSVNFPFYDDYFLLFDELIKFNHIDNYVDLIKELFTQHNDHRVFTHRLTFLIITKILGYIDVQYMMLIGNLIQIGIVLMVVNLFKKEKKIIYAIPVLLIILQPQQYINMFGSYGLYNNGVILFSFISIYFLSIAPLKSRLININLAIVFAFLATFSNGNGISIWFCGGIVLLLRKKYSDILIWIIVAMVTILIYFKWNYKVPIPVKTKVYFSFDLIFNKAIYFFSINTAACLVGSYYTPYTIIFMVIVALFEGGAIFLLLKRIYNTFSNGIPDKYCYLIGMLLFVTITNAIVSYFRSGQTISNLPAEYYRIYSLLLFVLCYYIYVSEITPCLPNIKKYFYIITTGLGSVFFVVSYYYYTHNWVIDQKNTLEADILNFKANRKVLNFFYINGFVGIGGAPHAWEVVNVIEKNNQFSIPQDKMYSWIMNQLNNLSANQYRLSIKYTNTGIVFFNDTYCGAEGLANTHPFIILKSDKKIYFLPTTREPVLSFRNHYRYGFKGIIDEQALKHIVENGNYQVYVMTRDKAGDCIYKTNQVIKNMEYVGTPYFPPLSTYKSGFIFK
ncbi:MAG: hypothetical protein QM669_06170 [Siphonobacter sp.]